MHPYNDILARTETSNVKSDDTASVHFQSSYRSHISIEKHYHTFNLYCDIKHILVNYGQNNKKK